ncbi:hypothetical protein [Epilithonimonas hungarica]|uniref:Uncharacterized protein n=1 Tax=Epilithonimonas hungarica TaxID=454006 RepID=A0A1G7TVL3_9FLAO|nr:hypothetical protein [Epilithonimonas hungarica]SDG39313.1 hypothetical protein SAMN05421825_3235 [Epilithonimonas hungarica]
MKKLFLPMIVLFIISCSKKDTTENSMSNDILTSDSTAAIPNPAPQTDSTTTSASGSVSDSSKMTPGGRRDSVR